MRIMKTKTEGPESGEGFLGRWARLKRSRAAEVSEPEVAEGAAEPEAEPFDPASLPALDTLDAVSDYTAFLKPGVPRELRTLALRRAWATDPAITGYKTLADYDWDFNAPGYGALRVTDNVKDLADRVFGMLKAEEEPKPEPAEPEVPEAEAAAVEVADVKVEPERIAAPVEEPVAEAAPEPPRRRRHGGAVPSFS
jgi:Protein of unknown function (DUF3306)